MLWYNNNIFSTILSDGQGLNERGGSSSLGKKQTKPHPYKPSNRQHAGLWLAAAENERFKPNPTPTNRGNATPRAVILSGEPMRVLFWLVVASPIKLNVGYGFTPFGSESKPEGRSYGSDLAGQVTSFLII